MTDQLFGLMDKLVTREVNIYYYYFSFENTSKTSSAYYFPFILFCINVMTHSTEIVFPFNIIRMFI